MTCVSSRASCSATSSSRAARWVESHSASSLTHAHARLGVVPESFLQQQLEPIPTRALSWPGNSLATSKGSSTELHTSHVTPCCARLLAPSCSTGTGRDPSLSR
jgi:hypothetical protein